MAKICQYCGKHTEERVYGPKEGFRKTLLIWLCEYCDKIKPKPNKRFGL